VYTGARESVHAGSACTNASAMNFWYLGTLAPSR
jgi:hypothetical protein